MENDQQIRLFRKACRRDDLEAVEGFLTLHPAWSRDHEAIMGAASVGSVAVVTCLLEAGADPDSLDPRRGVRRPLLQCLMPSGPPRSEGHVACARLLLEAGADPDMVGHFQSLPPLQSAAAAASAPLVEVLLAAGATLDGFAMASLYRVEALRRHLEGGNPGQRDGKGRTLMHALAASRYWRCGEEVSSQVTQAAQVLLDAGAEIDAPQEIEGKYKGTPLWWAVSYGKCVPLVAWLLVQGASFEGCMVAAAYQGDREILDLLLAAGAQVDARDVRGHSALQHVLLFKRPAAVPWLLAAGADPNLRANKGYTALHLAALCGHEPAILEALVTAGADVGTKDEEGQTALDLARASGKEEAAQLLEREA